MKVTRIAQFLCILSLVFAVSCTASLNSDNAKVSYGIGTQFANDMKNRGMEIDMKAFSQAVDTEYMEDFAEMLDIECVVIDGKTALRGFKNELRWNDAAFEP